MVAQRATARSTGSLDATEPNTARLVPITSRSRTGPQGNPHKARWCSLITAPCVWFKDLMTERPAGGGPMAVAGKHLMVQASVAVMSEHHRALWGFPWGPVRERLVIGTSRAVLGSVASKLPVDRAVAQLRDHVDAHAFGSRRTRTVSPPASEPAA